MMNIKDVEKRRNFFKWYMDNLSRNDIIGHLFAVLTSSGGIFLMIKIALM